MNRQQMLNQVRARQTPWDIAVIGGGATGVGIALDGASRGYAVVLFEQSDLGKGTSSRSTKLIHGGVRYLQQGSLALVTEALKERGILLRNAPHLVGDLAFIVPIYQWWEGPFYGMGLKLYDLLAGRCGFGHSVALSSAEVLERIPTLEPAGLRGGVLYHDGQFDDSRLLISLAQTAVERGACLINYAPAIRLIKDAGGAVSGLVFRDEESQEELTIGCRCVINATGAFCDELQRQDDPNAQPMISPSQGAHLVLDRSFLPGATAIMVPRTKDHRILFAIPWQGHVLVGTTDTPVHKAALEARPLSQEIDFILETAGAYLARSPNRRDILSAFAGIRPLVKTGHTQRTARLSRDHSIQVSGSGLLTIAGGKWTTYRKMAEETIDRAIQVARLDRRECVTRDLPIRGYHQHAEQFGHLACYGTDATCLQQLIGQRAELAQRLHAALPIQAVQVVWAVREEMARTVEDVLARRTRALFLNARAARAMAPSVARLMAQELGLSQEWQRDQIAHFEKLALGYLPE